MILQRFYDDKLAQASYLIGCQAAGAAVVIDPNRDIEQYLEAALAARVRITHVTETHIHADFVSGTRELAARTGARILLSAEGGPDWQYEFREDPNVQLLRAGDRFEVGRIMIDVAHTPGHTPEHIIFFVTDGAGADRPIGVVTGDFVFVGDVGRPDLLEKAAYQHGSMEASARTLFHSLQEFKEQPDYLQIWPGHGAGSSCGKSLSAIPHSTVGYERLFNWAFALSDEADFVRTVLADQPDPPRYFEHMKRINREGPGVLGQLPQPAQLDVSELERLVDQRATIVDTRLPHQFAKRHIGGAINIPLDRSFTTWGGWLLPYDRDIYLLVSRQQPNGVVEAVKALTSIGIDRIAGFVTDDVLSTWAANGRALGSISQVQTHELATQRTRSQVLDVRTRKEWKTGHLENAINIPLGNLPDRLAELQRDQPLIVQCESGARSAIAASLLVAHGFEVSNLVGGINEWKRQGGVVVQDRP